MVLRTISVEILLMRYIKNLESLLRTFNLNNNCCAHSLKHDNLNFLIYIKLEFFLLIN